MADLDGEAHRELIARAPRAKNQLKQDEIAVRQLHALIAFQRPRDKRLRLADVKEMFVQTRDQV